jgi:hypothetical protein
MERAPEMQVVALSRIHQFKDNFLETIKHRSSQHIKAKEIRHCEQDARLEHSWQKQEKI